MILHKAALTLLVALCGAAFAAAAGIPAAALLGSATAVTALSIAKYAGAVPPFLRDLGFAAIGVTLGATVGPDTLSQIALWPLSLCVQAVVLAAMMWCGAVLLTRVAQVERGAALLSVSPGALSVALALSESSGRDTRTVMILQGVRLLAVTVLVPPALAALGGAAGPGLRHPHDTGLLIGLTLLAAVFSLGRLGSRAGLPAAYLLAGVALSGTVHAAGWVEGRLPPMLSFAGFSIAGAVVGARFAGVRWSEMRRAGTAALAITAVSTIIAAGAAALVAPALGMPFGQVFVAYVPGGVEAMSAIALSLGYDPIYVGAHHIARIFVLIALLPVLLRRIGPAVPDPRG